MQVSEAIAVYLDHRRATVAPSTLKNDRYVLQFFGATAVGGRDIQIKNLTAVHVEGWFSSLRRPHKDRAGHLHEPIAAATWNYYRARVRSFLAFCTRRGLNRHDPMRDVQVLTAQRRPRRQPDAAAMLSMIDSTADPRNRIVLALVCNLGLRSSDIAHLRVGDVDADTATLTVWVSKSQLADQMPLTSDLEAELRRWLRTYRQALSRDLAAEDVLVPAATGPRFRWRTTPQGSRERYQVPSSYKPEKAASKLHLIAHEALATLGIDARGEGMHTFRRGVARHYFDMLAAEGHDGAVRQVSSLLHHSNAATTELYLGLSSERRQRDLSIRGKSMLRSDSTPPSGPLVAP